MSNSVLPRFIKTKWNILPLDILFPLVVQLFQVNSDTIGNIEANEGRDKSFHSEV